MTDERVMTPAKVDHTPSGTQESELRERAEAIVAKDDAASAMQFDTLSHEDARTALHELRVHQIELEMQNHELRRTQEELALAHIRYRDLFEMAPVGYLTVDGAGKILQANYCAANMLGVQRSALVDQLIVRLIPPDDQDKYYLHRRRLLEPGATDSCELRMLRQGDSPIWVELHSTLIWTEAGLPINSVTLTDITLRRATQSLLQQSEARSRAIAQSAIDAIITVDAEGCTVGWNRGAEAMFGVTEKDAIGRLMSDFVVHQGNGTPAQGRRADGTSFPVEQTSSTWVAEDGHFSTSIVRDVTEREKAAALLHLEGSALEASANAIMITDRAGVLQWANPAFSTLTGFTIEEAVGKRPGELLGSGKQGPAFYAELWRTIVKGTVWRGEMVDRRKDGSLFTVEMTITPVKDAAGEISHFIAISQDVSERKQLEEQLRQAQKMESIGRLAGGVAHDFNNMLTVILSRAELALSETEPDRQIYADLAEIRKAATRSAQLTKQLLTFARRQQVAPAIVDINTSVGNSLDMLCRLIGDDIVVDWVPDPRAGNVRMDPSQLDQVLANLLLNARAAMPGGGHLHVAVSNAVVDAAMCAAHADAEQGEYVRLLVKDDGIGMDQEVLGQIFEPFFTTKPVGDGTGLGLATVYGIVTQTGGFIVVTSSPGAGAAFEIYLPRHLGAEKPAPVVAAPSAPFARSSPGGDETILLVDDEPLVREVARRALESLGYRVLAAGGGDDALKAAAEHTGEINLLLTDVLMPSMNGRQLADALHGIRPSTRVLFMSGFAASVLTANGVLEKGTALLEKPFPVLELAKRVREVLDAPVGVPL